MTVNKAPVGGKTRRWLVLGSAMALWLLPAILWAAETHHAVETPFTLLMRAINFFLLAALLVWLLKKPVTDFLNQRQQKVRESLEEAERAGEEAEARYREVQQKLEKAESEMDELRRMLIDQGRREKEKILANAQKEAEKIRRQAALTAEQELKKARFMLRQEAVELAGQIATSILQDRIADKDHDALIRDYVEKLGKTA
jgi:F-type H+-transporting ATPase subunit b